MVLARIYDNSGDLYTPLIYRGLNEYFPSKWYDNDLPRASYYDSDLKVRHLHYLVDGYLAECRQSEVYNHYKYVAGERFAGMFKSYILKSIVKNMMVVMMNPQQHSQEGEVYTAVCMGALTLMQIQVVTKLSGLQNYKKYDFDLHGWIEANRKIRGGISTSKLIRWAKRFETALYPIAHERFPSMIKYGRKHNAWWLNEAYKIVVTTNDQ